MVDRTATRCGLDISQWLVEEIVYRCGGVPRRIVNATIDVSGYIKLNPGCTREQALRFMSVNDLFPAGLDSRGVGVLRVLAQDPERVMATGDLVEAAGLTRNVYDSEVRPSLVNHGDMLIKVTRGVSITPRGLEILSEVDV